MNCGRMLVAITGALIVKDSCELYVTLIGLPRQVHLTVLPISLGLRNGASTRSVSLVGNPYWCGTGPGGHCGGREPVRPGRG